MKATKLPSGNYRVRVEVGRDADGKRIWKSFTSSSKKKAELDAAQFQMLHVAPEDGKGSFREAAEAFLQSRGAVLSPASIRAYKSIHKCLKEYVPWFYRLQIYSVSTADLQKVVDCLIRRGLSPKTVKDYYCFISVILSDKGVLLKAPRLPQKERPSLNVPDEETVKQVIAAAEGSDIEVPILLAAFGPMRRGEICALTMDDIDGDVIHVCKDVVRDSEGNWITKAPKTYSSDRYITMPQKVIDLINKQGYVTDLNPDGLSRRFRRLLKKNDIPNFRFHDLRHFCCSYLHGMNVPDIYIMQRSGHSTTNTLRQIYTHTLQNQSKSETERIIDRFSSF
jgi:integrase